MQILPIPPDQDSYQMPSGSDDALEIVLDGGSSRRRADLDGATRQIEVQWSTDALGYNVLQAFYRTATDKGALPFYANLYNDTSEMDQYTCYFVNKTFALKSQRGNAYVCAATFEVLPNPINLAYDQTLLMLYSLYGLTTGQFINNLNLLANVFMPSI